MPPRKNKRTRGGQLGNQNARKHGFYATGLTLAEICEFWNVLNWGGLDPELIVLRIKLASVLRHDPANRRVLREASRLLAEWYRARYRLTGRDETVFRKVVRRMLETVVAKTIYFAGTNRACSDKKVSKTTERIEAETPRKFSSSASKKKILKKCIFTKRILPENNGAGRRPALPSLY